MEQIRPPKFLVNWNEENLDRHAIVKAVSEFLGLGTAEEALLDYYAGYETGWQASAKVIAEALTKACNKKTPTYNNKGDIEKLRSQLEEKGLISLNDRVILIDWRRLAGIAFANEVGREYNDTHIVSRGKRQHREKKAHKFNGCYDATTATDSICWKALQTDDPPIQLTEEEIAEAREQLKDTIRENAEREAKFNACNKITPTYNNDVELPLPF